jgi:hypothetical protein
MFGLLGTGLSAAIIERDAAGDDPLATTATERPAPVGLPIV